MACAGDPSIEWRLMGPAFSYHSSKEGAATDLSATQWKCDAFARSTDAAGKPMRGGFETQYASFTTTNPADIRQGFAPRGEVARQLAAPVATNTGYRGAPAGYMEYKVTGRPMTDAATGSTSFNRVSCYTYGAGSETRWHQNNPALGLEASVRNEGRIDKLFATIVRDSYGAPSFMAGAGRLWTLMQYRSVTVDGGITGGLWYRSTPDDDPAALKKVVVPFILPTLSITEATTGLGMEIAIAPRARFNGSYLASTTTLMFQSTWLIRGATDGSSKVGLEARGDGATLNFSTGF
jgi:hypothetical protein